MKWEDLVKSMPLTPEGMSLLLVEPNSEFLTWLKGFLDGRGRGRRNVYFAEENSVFLIPSYQRLGDDYESFLLAIKPRLFLSELYRFGAVEADFPDRISASTFDRYFSLILRDEVTSLKDLFQPGG